jgi:predicted Mrr-cat superfamily restriction endonuclease
MKSGDLVMYPSRRDRQIYLGRMEGGDRYGPNTWPS